MVNLAELRNKAFQEKQVIRNSINTYTVHYQSEHIQQLWMREMLLECVLKWLDEQITCEEQTNTATTDEAPAVCKHDTSDGDAIHQERKEFWKACIVNMCPIPGLPASNMAYEADRCLEEFDRRFGMVSSPSVPNQQGN